MAPKRRQHPIDKGWAWVVLAATMGTNLLCGAQVYFVGVVHTGLLDKFQPDTVTFLALTGAVYSSLMCLAAPVASYIINRFSCRVCCVLGGLLCFVGYTSSAFVTSVTPLFFTYGITAGLGLGFAYSATNITIGFYFDRLRGAAAGISNSISAFGILAGPAVFQGLVEEYDISGAFLLLGAISLHYSFFGMFYRPTRYEGNTIEMTVNESEKKHSNLEIKEFGTDHKMTVNESDKKHSNLEIKELGTDHKKMTISSEQTFTEDYTEQSYDTDTVTSQQPLLGQDQRLENSSGPFLGSTTSCTGETNVPITDDKTVNFDISASGSQAASNVIHDWIVDDVKAEAAETRLEKAGSADLFLVSSIPNDVNESVPDSTEEAMLPDHSYEEECGDRSLDYAQPDTCLIMPSSKAADCAKPSSNDGKRKSRMKLLTRFRSSSLVKIMDKAFLFHCAALFVANVHISGVFLHLPEYAKVCGTTAMRRAELFVVVGVFSLVSKLGCGLATSDPRIDPLILSVGLMGLNGVFTSLFPLYADTYVKQMVFSSLFGLYFGGLYALMTPTLVRFVRVEKLALAYGISMFVLGVGYAMGPTIAGLIVDAGGTYGHSFVFLGLMMLAGSFLDMGAACSLQSGNSAPEVSPETNTHDFGNDDNIIRKQ